MLVVADTGNFMVRYVYLQGRNGTVGDTYTLAGTVIPGTYVLTCALTYVLIYA